MGRRIRDSETVAKVEAKPSQEVSTGFSIEKKIADIKASALPEHEKERYICRLTGDKGSGGSSDQVPFTVWANVRGIKDSIRRGMLAHPNVKGRAGATFAEWDEIFKDF